MTHALQLIFVPCIVLPTPNYPYKHDNTLYVYALFLPFFLLSCVLHSTVVFFPCLYAVHSLWLSSAWLSSFINLFIVYSLFTLFKNNTDNADNPCTATHTHTHNAYYNRWSVWKSYDKNTVQECISASHTKSAPRKSRWSDVLHALSERRENTSLGIVWAPFYMSVQWNALLTDRKWKNCWFDHIALCWLLSCNSKGLKAKWIRRKKISSFCSCRRSKKVWVTQKESKRSERMDKNICLYCCRPCLNRDLPRYEIDSILWTRSHLAESCIISSESSWTHNKK